MNSRNTALFNKFVDFIVWPAIALIIIVYCSLIFVSRSVLGTTPTFVLLALGAVALTLWARAALHSAKLNRE